MAGRQRAAKGGPIGPAAGALAILFDPPPADDRPQAAAEATARVDAAFQHCLDSNRPERRSVVGDVRLEAASGDRSDFADRAKFNGIVGDAGATGTLTGRDTAWRSRDRPEMVSAAIRSEKQQRRQKAEDKTVPDPEPARAI